MDSCAIGTVEVPPYVVNELVLDDSLLNVEDEGAVKENAAPRNTIQKDPFSSAPVQKELVPEVPIQEDLNPTKEGPYSWQKSTVVSCDTEEVMTQSQVIDDDVLLYDDTPHRTHGKFTETTNEVDELKCNLCENIIKGGFRYSCVQCPDFDLCGACEAKGAHRMHYVLRSPGTKDVSEVQLMLRLFRQALLVDSIVPLFDHSDRLEGEIKEEVVEEPHHEHSEEDDPLSSEINLSKQTHGHGKEDDPLSVEIASPEATIQESSLDECWDTESTESEENEPPPKRAAPSKFYAANTISRPMIINKDNLSSSCVRNKLLNMQKLKSLTPVSDINRQIPKNPPKRSLIVKHIPANSLPLTELSSQQIRKVNNLVSMEAPNGQHSTTDRAIPENKE
ncbi:uncharacterized protein LOC113228288 [Hyposmocoma kahamanoa]|uniref:uncharacterized protein LOC113228288 n=1 Tax=Hyposmocoma kahamanoa TaxID=1477025 RepID=UPI000E6D5C55|nr:uncharacterized protein LOC113228288 [Hyposmocoma kahamanoa]